MSHRLTAAQIQQFREQGYIKNLRVWDEVTIDRARAHFQHVTADLADQGLTHNDVNGWWAVNRGFWELCKTPSVLDCLEDLLGPDLFIWGGQFFYKAPGDPATVPWHQDAAYWPLSPRQNVVTAWIALYDTDSTNACMRVIPGTHRDLLAHEGAAQQSDVLEQALKADEFDESEAVDVDLRAGEMSLHTDALAHGSGANASDRPRCGMTMRVAAADVKADLSKWPSFHWIRLRGNAAGERNPTLQPPETDNVPTGYNQFGVTR